MNNEVGYEEEYVESSDEFKKNGFVFPDSFDVDETNKKIDYEFCFEIFTFDKTIDHDFLGMSILISDKESSIYNLFQEAIVYEENQTCYTY